MELHRIIKQDSKKLLRTCWGKSAAGLLAVFASYLAITITEGILLFVFSTKESFAIDFYDLASTSPEVFYITFGAAFLMITVMAPLILGYKKLHFSFAEKGGENISVLFSMFSGFESYFRSVIFFCDYTVRLFVSFALAILPGGALYFFCKTHIISEERTMILLRVCGIFLGFAITVLLVILWLIYIQRWFTAEYYFFSGEKLSSCFRKSARCTKGLRVKLLRFYISFFGWYLLSVFIFPLLWLLPYCITAKSIYAKYLAESYEKI